MSIKQKAKDTKEFVYRNRYQIGYSLYIVGCFALGYYGTKKVMQAQNAVIQREVEHETLRMAAASGHQFKFEPETNTLWDITLRPDKAG